MYRSHRPSQEVQVHPQDDGKKFYRHFCWNEAKMGLNLVRCTPADESEGSWWQYMTYMSIIFLVKKKVLLSEKILAMPKTAVTVSST